jgi:hypothetical protein
MKATMRIVDNVRDDFNDAIEECRISLGQSSNLPSRRARERRLERHDGLAAYQSRQFLSRDFRERLKISRSLDPRDRARNRRQLKSRRDRVPILGGNHHHIAAAARNALGPTTRAHLVA